MYICIAYDKVVTLLDEFSYGCQHILLDNSEENPQKKDPKYHKKYYWVSQTDIVKFIYKNLNQMSAIITGTIDKIGLIKDDMLNEYQKSFIKIN